MTSQFRFFYFILSDDDDDASRQDYQCVYKILLRENGIHENYD